MVGWVEYQLFRKVAGDVLRRYACSSVVFDKWDSRKGRQFVFSAFKIHISLEAELTYFSVTHLHQWVGVFLGLNYARIGLCAPLKFRFIGQGRQSEKQRDYVGA